MLSPYWVNYEDDKFDWILMVKIVWIFSFFFSSSSIFEQFWHIIVYKNSILTFLTFFKIVEIWLVKMAISTYFVSFLLPSHSLWIKIYNSVDSICLLHTKKNAGGLRRFFDNLWGFWKGERVWIRSEGSIYRVLPLRFSPSDLILFWFPSVYLIFLYVMLLVMLLKSCITLVYLETLKLALVYWCECSAFDSQNFWHWCFESYLECAELRSRSWDLMDLVRSGCGCLIGFDVLVFYMVLSWPIIFILIGFSTFFVWLLQLGSIRILCLINILVLSLFDNIF